MDNWNTGLTEKNLHSLAYYENERAAKYFFKHRLSTVNIPDFQYRLPNTYKAMEDLYNSIIHHERWAKWKTVAVDDEGRDKSHWNTKIHNIRLSKKTKSKYVSRSLELLDLLKMSVGKKNFQIATWDSYCEYLEDETQTTKINKNLLQVLRIDIDLNKELTEQELNNLFDRMEIVVSNYGFEMNAYKTGGNGLHLLIQLPYEIYLPLGNILNYMIREHLRAITDPTQLNICMANTDNTVLRIYGAQHPRTRDLACLYDLKNRTLVDYPDLLKSFSTKLRCSGINTEPFKQTIEPIYDVFRLLKTNKYKLLHNDTCKEIINENLDIPIFKFFDSNVNELKPFVSSTQETIDPPRIISEAQESPIEEPVTEPDEEDLTDVDALIKRGMKPGDTQSRIKILVNAYYTKYGDSGYDLLCNYIHSVPASNVSSFEDRLRSVNWYWERRKRIKPKKVVKVKVVKEKEKRKIEITNEGIKLRKLILKTLNLKNQIQSRQLKTLKSILEVILSEMIQENSFTKYTLSYRRIAEYLNLNDKIVARTLNFILSEDSFSENNIFVKYEDFYIETLNIDPNKELVVNDNIRLNVKYRKNLS